MSYGNATYYTHKILRILEQGEIILPANVSHTFFSSFGRTALFLLLSALDCRGKEVLLPAFTCPESVVKAVAKAGAIPVFVDIDPRSLNFDLSDLEKKISDRSVAIVSHHYFGMVNTWVKENWEIARRFGLVHIEDCCHSMGARLYGMPIGSYSDASFYSLAKTFGSPGGGLIVCRSEWLGNKIRNYLAHSSNSSKAYSVMKAFHFINYGYTLWVLNHFIKTRIDSYLKKLFLGSLLFFALALCIASCLEKGTEKFRHISEFDLDPKMAKIQYLVVNLQRYH